jgi:hypothetical protein
MMEIQTILTSAVVSAVVAAFSSFITARMTINNAIKKERYEKIAYKLIECLNEFKKIGPPRFDNSAMRGVEGNSEKAMEEFQTSFDRLGEAYSLFERYKTFIDKNKRLELEELATKLSRMKAEAAMYYIKQKGEPDMKVVDKFLIEFLSGAIEFGSKFEKTLEEEIIHYNEKL